VIRTLWLKCSQTRLASRSTRKLHSDKGIDGRAIAQTVSRRLPNVAGGGFEPRSRHVGFVVDKVALGQVFLEYFGFPCQFSFQRLLRIHHHLSSGAGTIGQLVADVPSGLKSPHPKKLKKKKKSDSSYARLEELVSLLASPHFAGLLTYSS
jgi:hypothetical protein